MEQQMGLSNAMLGNGPNPPGAERDVMGPSPRAPAAQAFPTHPLLQGRAQPCWQVFPGQNWD